MVVLDGNFVNDFGADTETTYVASYDLTYAHGLGKVETTTDPDDAMTWPTSLAVYEAWKQVCPTFPIRADGKANRPLTALTITTAKVDDDA